MGLDPEGPDRLVHLLRREGVQDKRILAAMKAVPRDRFCLPEDRRDAWSDEVLPLKHGATLSQPSLVATMIEELDLRPGERVLDLGSGSGYTTALLAWMGLEVFAVEVEPRLVRGARRRLAELGLEAQMRQGNAWNGWPEGGEFGAILVSAAAEEVPSKLLEQLAPGGRMVLPVGEETGPQELVKVVRSRDGRSYDSESLFAVSFVPLRRRGTPIGGQGGGADGLP